MALYGWQRQYLEALLTSNTARAQEFESVSFFASIIHEAPNGAHELMLHRLIMRLATIQEALDLTDILRATHWDNYAPRGLAKIADTEDRKSTRLNSSHVSKSYAVFCLRKKNSGEAVIDAVITLHSSGDFH